MKVVPGTSVVSLKVGQSKGVAQGKNRPIREFACKRPVDRIACIGRASVATAPADAEKLAGIGGGCRCPQIVREIPRRPYTLERFK